MNTTLLKTLIVAVAVTVGGAACAASLDNFQFLKIAPQDKRAVVKGPDGKLQIIKPGDVLAGNATVKEIAAGRVVLEEKTDKGLVTVIVRVENGKSHAQRLRSTPTASPLPVMPGKTGADSSKHQRCVIR